MLLPARPLLIGATLWLVLAAGAAFVPPLLPLWVVCGLLLLVLALADAAYAWWEVEPEASREVPAALPLGVATPVNLHLRWPGRGRRTARLSDHAPADCEARGLPAKFQLVPAASTTVTYRLRPLQRGDQYFGRLDVRLRSWAGLWWKQVGVPMPASVKVYPNFSVYSQHALQAADAAALRMGLLRRRRRGEGLDFEQLREYRQGDTARQIDWKATARSGKLISREFQDERDQRILLLVDCGRRMAARDDLMSHFDHALDALMLLAYVGLRHGDAIGLMTLGGTPRMLAPQKTPATLSRILNTVYDLQPSLAATDFETAAEELISREKKRALVVLLTNLRDEDDESLLAAVRLLRRHHLVLVASLREKALDACCATRAEHDEIAALRDTALDYRTRRDAAFQRLRQHGVFCLDVAPDELATATVNRYLAIKAEGLL